MVESRVKRYTSTTFTHGSKSRKNIQKEVFILLLMVRPSNMVEP